jgi:hypothetical protein
MRITQIVDPFRGEHLAATSPVMRPETPDARWRLRLDFWAGRALTAQALELEQDNRAAALAWRGRIASPGVVRGLEVALEAPSGEGAVSAAGHFVHVLPGHAFLPDGEDIVVPRPLRVALDQIPVHYVRVGGPDRGDPTEDIPAGASAGSPRNAGGFVFAVDRFPAGHVPWAAVLVVCPAEFRAFAGVAPDDPCELDASRDAFADERRVDAAVLRLCQLPARWERLSFFTGANRLDPRYRNRLAHILFVEESIVSARQYVRRDIRPEDRPYWDTVLHAADLMPWELLGVPIALLSRERIQGTARAAFFLDRGAVVRPGGIARPRTRPAARLATPDSPATLNPPGAGTPIIWRARVDQFAEHVSAFAANTEEEIAALRTRFQFVPPVGFLPRAMLDLMTTQAARDWPRPPNQPADRAGTFQFFPQNFGIEAVPVALEDLDAVLASGAALLPYDLSAESGDFVRMLVPLPQRVFDPRLLVVEDEDPIFAQTVARLVATRQGWRQRRDFVRGRRDDLHLIAAGPPRTPAPALDPGQLEPEPTRTEETLEVGRALVSPATGAGPWEVSLDSGSGVRNIELDSTVFFKLRVDEDAMPSRIEGRWRREDGEELRYVWTEPPPFAPLDDDQTTPFPMALWRRFEATGEQLGLTDEEETARLTGFTLHIDDGRIALAQVGELTPGEGGENTFENVWFTAGDEPTQFVGGDWTLISGRRLLAPFEHTYEPVFPDGRDLSARIGEVEAALNPEGATDRANEMHVDSHGLQRVLDELEAEASEADDFVDANFTRAQVNLYRIRKLVLGETAAQKLLVNPAIALIAEQQTATATAEKLGTFIATAKAKIVKPTAAEVNAAMSKPAITSVAPASGERNTTISATINGTNLTRVSAVAISGAGVSVRFGTGTMTSLPVTITIRADAPLGPRSVTVTAGGATITRGEAFTVTAADRSDVGGTRLGDTIGAFDRAIGGFDLRAESFDRTAGTDFLNRATFERSFTTVKAPIFEHTFAAELKIDTLKDVFGQRPETGPTLPPRGLAIGERFKEPPATQNLSYARAALNEFLLQLPKLRLPLVGQTVPSLLGAQVSLLRLQGRAVVADGSPSGTTPETLRNEAIDELLKTTPLIDAPDEAEVSLAAIDFTEIKSAALRTIERVILQRRALIQTGIETLQLVLQQRDLASPRVLAIEGRLDEARHDVSVARALRREEQDRVNAINDRRDALIRDEVRFIAYVRPRTFDPIRRQLPAWRLEAFGVPAPVPACLQRHDEPPAPMAAYVQLFRHAPVRWFPEMEPLIAKLDTPEKLIALLDTSRLSAGTFAALETLNAIRTSVAAVQFTVQGAHQMIGALRQKSALIQIADRRRRWKELYRDALEHATVGDLIMGRHGSADVSTAAAAELALIGQVATCLHAEFAAVTPAIRLAWIERFSQFDKPGLLRDLTVLPQYGKLDRNVRRRLQEFADWLFLRVKRTERDAVNLINDLVRLALLLASHAPVNRIIAGHIPRPTPVRPGIRIPITALNPELVRVGMEFHVWHTSKIVARGRVEDLREAEVSAHVEHVAAQTTTLDTSMHVQFVAPALSLLR